MPDCPAPPRGLTRTRWAVWILLGLGTLLAWSSGRGVAADGQPSGADRYPGTQWDSVSPERAGWSADRMAEARAWASATGATAVVVVQHGAVLASWGAAAEKLELHSVRKSLLSALIGIAVAQRRINVRETLASLGIDDTPPSLTAEEKQATVVDLLEARSGVYHVALYETPGMAATRPPRGSHLPGTFWYYNNWDFNVLGTIYERAVGTSIFAAFAREIAAPIGMQDYEPGDGRYVTGPQSTHPAYPFRMSARDLARFALLYLRRGRWGARQLVPADWIDASTTAHSLTDIGSGYGYLWWTGFPDRRVPAVDVPPGGFWAEGFLGQYAFVIPSDDLVVVSLNRAGPAVTRRQAGRLLWLILSAAHAPDAGADTLPGVPTR